MPSTHYQQAHATLSLAQQAVLASAFAALEAQIKANIENETALQVADFSDLLQAFLAQIGTGQAANNAWGSACRGFQLRGKAILPAQCPITLGKLKPLHDHATHVHKASSGKLTPDAAAKLLRKHSGLGKLPAFSQILHDAVLGDYIIWATFKATDTNSHPYPHLPQTHAGILAALGLGYSSSTDPLVFLAWNHQAAGTPPPPLHRPTIADAGNYRFFRPNLDATAWHGWTEPLPHSTMPVFAQPEIVLGKITCAGLKLPFYVIEA